MNSELILDLITSDGYIRVNKRMLKCMGVDEALVLCELLSRYKYFLDHGLLTEDGYFYNTADNLSEVLPYSKSTQYRIIYRLVELGVLDYKIAGNPPKRYFRPNLSGLEQLLLLRTIDQTERIAIGQNDR